ncbi:MAG: hypothetical protein GY756_26285 [bacterium]|nr:hypothetical protein [bacterium]
MMKKIINLIGTWIGPDKTFTKIENNFKHAKDVWSICKDSKINEHRAALKIYSQKNGIIKAKNFNPDNPESDTNELTGMISLNGNEIMAVARDGIIKLNIIDEDTIEMFFSQVEYHELQILCHAILKRVE